jgi:hypothetical protein
MRALLLLLLSLPAFAASEASLDDQIIATVIKGDIADLDPRVVRRFLELDLEKLPEKKRRSARAKRLAIETALRLSDGKKKGGIRTVPPEKVPKEKGDDRSDSVYCGQKRQAESDGPMLAMAGFNEIDPSVMDCVEQKTNCSEADLMCEFTLHVTLGPPTRDGLRRKRYYVHANDPIQGKVAECMGKGGGQTPFFGTTVLACNKLVQ